MQNLQDSVYSIVKTTSLSPAVFSYLQPTDEHSDKTPLGGILSDNKYAWLALGPKFCVVDLRTGLKTAAWTFGTALSTFHTSVSCVVELPTSLTENSTQLVISLECEDITGMICIFHINGSMVLRSIQMEAIVTELSVCDSVPEGPFTCFDGVIVAGTKSGEILAFDLNRASLMQALNDISDGNEHLVRNEMSMANVTFLPLESLSHLKPQRQLALENDDHIGVLLNESSIVDGQYIFYNPDGTIRMRAKRDHVKVSAIQYIPPLASLAVGFNFGAFQIWNLMTLELEFTSQVNVECLPVTHFGFQEPCDDPRAFCYLWAVYSEAAVGADCPLAVLHSLSYRGKRPLADTGHLYQDFQTASVCFQVELSAPEGAAPQAGGRCVSCLTYSVASALGEEGEDSKLNICQLVWECWGDGPAQYHQLLFDLDQWYKDQMPASRTVATCAFLARSGWSRGDWRVLAARLTPPAPFVSPARLEEHFYPNALAVECICLSTSDICTLSTAGLQRQLITALLEGGEQALMAPAPMYAACLAAGLAPLYTDAYAATDADEQRRFLLSVALEARLTRLLRRCVNSWAGSGGHPHCTISLLVDWCWRRGLELKTNAAELIAPLSSAAEPDRNVIRCLEQCARQLTELAGLMDCVLTKCCNLVAPGALQEMESMHACLSSVSQYLAAWQWLRAAGLLPGRVPYPAADLAEYYTKRRLKLERLRGDGGGGGSLLYIDNFIERECGGEEVYEAWGSVYPPPSLGALLRVYLRPDVPQQQKHSLVLYMLLDYSMLYDGAENESLIRRLMQFPTMFGLSNAAIKVTQAFWHLDHRDFDFALDQLQCLSGGALSEWQHRVVLSALLAQHRPQAALQYLHVRKPPPRARDVRPGREPAADWRACCDLYLARGLVFEAADVARACVADADTHERKVEILEYFFKACSAAGLLSRALDVALSPLEEAVLARYLRRRSDAPAADMLVMFYLQRARYIEAQQLNAELRSRGRPDAGGAGAGAGGAAAERAAAERAAARDALVEAACAALPAVAAAVADYAMNEMDDEPHVVVPKPMSVYVRAHSPENTFTYKPTFIQDSLESASATWARHDEAWRDGACRDDAAAGRDGAVAERGARGTKRPFCVEETPFLCTPRIRDDSGLAELSLSPHTPPKRPRPAAPDTPAAPATPAPAAPAALTRDLAAMLDIDDQGASYRRDGRDTPQSILKSRRRDDSDDELLDTASVRTGLSDSTSKHLRFTVPSPSEAGSTPSPPPAAPSPAYYADDVPTGEPPAPASPRPADHRRRVYRDSVRARASISNSSLSDDPSASIESIADMPVTLVNPRYRPQQLFPDSYAEGDNGHNPVAESTRLLTSKCDAYASVDKVEKVLSSRSPPKTPKGRRSIRDGGASRSQSVTPERQDSPVVPAASLRRFNRSRSRTPETSPRLPPVPELPAPELPAPERITNVRARTATPERRSPRLEPISESPAAERAQDPPSARRSLRSRSRTPEVEASPEPADSPRTLRSRSKTPDREKLLTPVDKPPKQRKSLTRIVLEHNTFKTRTEATTIECTPMKAAAAQTDSLLDVTFSPILNKSVLRSPADSLLSDADITVTDESFETEKKSLGALPAFTTISETFLERSVLVSDESSADASVDVDKPAVAEVIEPSTSKSMLKDASSLMTSDSDASDLAREQSENERKEQRRIVEIVREIDAIEEDCSEGGRSAGDSGGDTAGDSAGDSGEDTAEGSGGDTEEDSEEMEGDRKREEDSSSEDSDADDEENDAVISIASSTSDDDSSPSSGQLLIDERSAAPSESTADSAAEGDGRPETADPLHHASLLTDDNSVHDDDDRVEVALNYSDDSGAEKEDADVEMETEIAPEVEVSVAVIATDAVEPDMPSLATAPTTGLTTAPTTGPATADEDVVDAVTAEPPEQPAKPIKSSPKKRTTSTSSNQDRTPRKRNKSTSSDTTPEVRRILTRRASRELSESKLDVSVEPPDSPAPARRSARTRSRDDASAAGTASTGAASTTSTGQEEPRPAPIRKTRKSVLLVKPDLSVIPEVAADDGQSREQATDIINEYSSSRRLTRHQRSLLESWLEPSPRAAAAAAAAAPRDESADVTEISGSPDSTVSETNARRSRLGRAASESKTLPRPARPLRRGSVDVASPALSEQSPATPPGRPRRACFTRACGALSTPRRRASQTSESGSPAPDDGPAPAPSPGPAPARRRRAASSSSQPDTPRRSRKASATEQSKD